MVPPPPPHGHGHGRHHGSSGFGHSGYGGSYQSPSGSSFPSLPPGGFPAPPGRGRDCSLGFNELCLNPDGTIMSREQIVQERQKRGLCTTCPDHPTQCFEQKERQGRFGRMSRFADRFASLSPRTEAGVVEEGVCLRCNPPAASATNGGSRGHGHGHGHGHGSSARSTAYQSSRREQMNRTHASRTVSRNIIGESGSSGMGTARHGSGSGSGSDLQGSNSSSSSGGRGGGGGGGRGNSGSSLVDALADMEGSFAPGASGGTGPRGHQDSIAAQSTLGGTEMIIIDAECTVLGAAPPTTPAAAAPSSSASPGHVRSSTHSGSTADLTDHSSSSSSSHRRSLSEADADGGDVDRMSSLLRQMGHQRSHGHGHGHGGHHHPSVDHMETVAENGNGNGNGNGSGGDGMPRAQADQTRQVSDTRANPEMRHQESGSLVAHGGARQEEEDNLADEDLKHHNSGSGDGDGEGTPRPPLDPKKQRLVEIKMFLQDMLTADTPDGDMIAIEQISSQMLADQRWTELQDYGLTVLSMLSRKTQRNKELIADGSGLNALVQGMAETVESVRAQDFGCRALWSTAVAQRNRSKIAAAGGCGRIVDALKQHGMASSGEGGGEEDKDAKDEEEVTAMIQSALGAMKPLTTDERARTELEKKGAPAVVTAVMASRPSVAKIQSDGCAILSNLVVDSVRQAVRVGSAEEFAAIVSAMTAHPDDEKVQRSACGALSNYTFSDSNASQLARVGGEDAKDALVKAGEKFPTSCGEESRMVLDRLRLGRVVTAAAAAQGGGGGEGTDFDGGDPEEEEAYQQVTTLLKNGALDATIKVSCIAETMLDFMYSLRVQSAGLLGLASLTANSNDACGAVAAGTQEGDDDAGGGGALVALLRAVEMFGTADATVQSRACDVLGHVARSSRTNREDLARFLGGNGTERVAALMRAHPSDEGVQVSALRTLGALTAPADDDTKTVDNGGGGDSGAAKSAVEETMDRFGSSRTIQAMGNEVLRNIAESDDSSGHLNGASGGVEDPAADRHHGYSVSVHAR